jgi:CheY-like chemotaxis protein
VYGIVKQHQGWIEVESEVGKGTTFLVYLPVTQKTAAAEPTPAPVAAPVHGGKETVLVVEDEQVLREMARVILEDSGYRVIAAASGVEAVSVWDKEKDSIDLVLTDMIMPEGMSGMELAQRLLAAKPGLKVIVASGYSVDDFEAQMVRKGQAMFLQKPYTHVSLTKAVRECLDGTVALRG